MINIAIDSLKTYDILFDIICYIIVIDVLHWLEDISTQYNHYMTSQHNIRRQ